MLRHTPRSRYIQQWHHHCQHVRDARRITAEALAGMVLANHHDPLVAFARLRLIRKDRPHPVLEEAERLVLALPTGRD